MPEQMTVSCPLGIVEIDGACNPIYCSNREYCRRQTRAWDLPYWHGYDGCLYARTVSVLIEREAYWNEALEESSGAYLEYLCGEADEELWLLNQWLEAVHEAGWHSPEDLPYKAIPEGGLVVDSHLHEFGFYPSVALAENPGLDEWVCWGVWDIPDWKLLVPQLS